MTSVNCDEKTSGTLVHALQHLDDSASWHRFIQLYEPMFRVWLKYHGVSNGASEDIVSEVYCKLLVNLPKFVYDPHRSFRGWLRVIVDNAATDALRRESRKKKFLVDVQSDSLSTTAKHSRTEFPDSLETLTQAVEHRLKLAQAVVRDVRARVAATTWDAFFLKEIEGWSGDNVASHLGIPIQNVYVHVFRIRKMLNEARNRLATPLPEESFRAQ